jgi:thymidine phosphorylase
VTVTPAAPPNSLDAVRAKIQGRTLSASDIGAVVDDLVHYRYSDMEIAAFLISSASFMTSDDAMRLRKLFEFVGDHFGISVEVVTTDGRQPIGSGIGPVLEAQDVMAVLANEPGAPLDLREKSLRLAAHLLEYDPDLRGGAGYARARKLLDGGAALKQMQKIIDAQGPSICRTDLGILTADVPAPNDGTVSGIDCLRLNRLARTAGAPIDKGAGIKVFKKIGDPVEKGEPLYRVYTFDRSEYNLAGGSHKGQYGLRDRRMATASQRENAVSDVAIQSLPVSTSDARRLASRLGVPSMKSSCIGSPTGKYA